MAERRPLVINDGRIEEFPVGDTLPPSIGGGGGSTTIVSNPTIIDFDPYITASTGGVASTSGVLAKGVGLLFTEDRTLLNIKFTPGTLGQTLKIVVWEVDQVPSPAIVQSKVWESDTITVAAEMVGNLVSISTGPNGLALEGGKSYSFLATLVGAGTFVDIQFTSVNPLGTSFIAARDGHRINNAGDITGLDVFFLENDHYIIGFDSIPTAFVSLTAEQVLVAAGWSDLGLVNGDFETGDSTGWTTDVGTIQIVQWAEDTDLITAGMTVGVNGTYYYDGGSTVFTGGSNQPSVSSYQDFDIVGSTALMFQAQATQYKTNPDADVAYIEVELRKAGQSIAKNRYTGTGGFLNSEVMTATLFNIENADTLRVRIGCTLNEGTTINVGLDNVTARALSGASISGGNSYPDFSGNAGKFLRTNDTETGVQWQDVASTIAASDDMTIIPESLLPVDIGRPVGLIGLNSSVAEFGLLERPTLNPMGGGVDVLGDYDLTSLSQTSMVFQNADKYERIVIMGHDIVCSTTVNVSFSSDNGATDLVHALRRGRLFWNNTATAPISVENTVTYETTSDVFLISAATTSGGTVSVAAEINGFAAKTGILTMKKDHFNVDAYNHQQSSVSKTDVVPNSFRIWSASPLTGGRLVVYGIKQNAQPMPLSFDYSGTPGASGRLARMVTPYGLTLRTGATGSFRVGSNPSGTETVDIQKNGVSIGSISITSGGVATVSITTDTAFLVGDLLSLDVDGARTFTDLFGSFQSELTE